MAERTERIHIPIPVVVEGKYDKIKLSSVIDANVITTGGFGIFNKKEKLALIRTLAEKGGIVILTDSDGAGGVIRSYIKSALPKEKIYNLYIPQIEGKERRKSTSSKEGTLGVEGMTDEVLRGLFSSFSDRMGFSGSAAHTVRESITKADLFELGLTGAGSADRRDALCRRLSLPAKMTPNAFLGALNILLSKEELYEICKDEAADA